MLDQRRHRRSRQSIVSRHSGGHGILEGNAELRSPGSNQSVRSAFRRLHDLHFQPLILKISQTFGHIKTSVIGIGRPVQNESDLFCLIISSGNRHASRRANRHNGSQSDCQYLFMIHAHPPMAYIFSE